MKQGLLLLAHGARDRDWAAPFEDIARRVRLRQPNLPVVLAFLEFITPDFATATAQLASAGCTQVDVLPLFLGAGGHVRRDVPTWLDAARTQHPTVHWTLHPAVGEMDSIVQAISDAAVTLARQNGVL